MRHDIAKRFRWRTMEGEVLTLDQMSTKHIFNSMKMIFNHIAEEYGVPTVWYQHKYRDYQIGAMKVPKKLARQIHLFVMEIEERGDLPYKYREPYWEILDIIRSGIISDPEQLLNRKGIGYEE